jgi:hypothetical protein
MENGSTTAELGRVLRAVQALGIELDAIVPGESAKPTAADVSGTSTGADDLDAIVRAHTPRTAR